MVRGVAKQRQLALKLELRNPVRAPLSRSVVTRIALNVLRFEGLKGPYRLGVHLLDDSRLKDANLAQRGIDSPTDVLSFPLLADKRDREGAMRGSGEPGALDRGFVLPPGESVHLGDVLISYERTETQAAEYGHTVEREICYLLAHGVLHLLGYDHEEEGERREMRLREEAALKPLGLSRDEKAPSPAAAGEPAPSPIGRGLG